MFPIAIPARRTLLRISAFALCTPLMRDQTANAGAMAGNASDPAKLWGHVRRWYNTEAAPEDRDLATDAAPWSQEICANGAGSGDDNFILNGGNAKGFNPNTTEVLLFGGAGVEISLRIPPLECKAQTSLYDARMGEEEVRT